MCFGVWFAGFSIKENLVDEEFHPLVFRNLCRNLKRNDCEGSFQSFVAKQRFERVWLRFVNCISLLALVESSIRL